MGFVGADALRRRSHAAAELSGGVLAEADEDGLRLRLG